MSDKALSYEDLWGDAPINDTDPTTRVRSRPMRLIVIGMPRTGTMSQRAALEKLGYKVHHMITLARSPQDGKLWQEAFESKYKPGRGGKCSLTRKEWDMLLSDYDACMDFPAAAFVPELIAAYPEAKVIVSQRPAEKWYISFEKTVGRSRRDISTVATFFLDSVMRPWVRMLLSMDYVWPGGSMGDRDAMMTRYDDMHDEVRVLMRRPGYEGRMLEYKLGDGWEPLCKFLEVPLPSSSEPFPHLNETKEFGLRVQLLKIHSLKRVGRKAAAWVGSGLVVGAMAYYTLL